MHFLGCSIVAGVAGPGQPKPVSGATHPNPGTALQHDAVPGFQIHPRN